jgi:hypothetical protein
MPRCLYIRLLSQVVEDRTWISLLSVVSVQIRDIQYVVSLTVTYVNNLMQTVVVYRVYPRGHTLATTVGV